MKYAIVSGSHRKGSQSEKVARYLEGRLLNFDTDSDVSIISLASNPLPLWDEDYPAKSAQWKDVWEPISAKLNEADAFVFVVPEWGGMVPPGMKNFLLLCSRELAHKPALLVAVSAGPGGSYPISELRASGYKNTHVSYLPEHLIIRNVGNVLNEGTINSALQEEQLRERIDYSLRVLKVYGNAYQTIRDAKELELGRYPYGM